MKIVIQSFIHIFLNCKLKCSKMLGKNADTPLNPRIWVIMKSCIKKKKKMQPRGRWHKILVMEKNWPKDGWQEHFITENCYSVELWGHFIMSAYSTWSDTDSVGHQEGTCLYAPAWFPLFHKVEVCKLSTMLAEGQFQGGCCLCIWAQFYWQFRVITENWINIFFY